MSEIRSISEGSFVLGDTNNLTFEAGTGIKVDSPSEGTVRIANDETVLYSGDGTNIVLSEAPTNFKFLRITLSNNQGLKYVLGQFTGSYLTIGSFAGVSNAWIKLYQMEYNSTTKAVTVVHTKDVGTSFSSNSTSLSGSVDQGKNDIKEIVGINRIAGGN